MIFVFLAVGMGRVEAVLRHRWSLSCGTCAEELIPPSVDPFQALIPPSIDPSKRALIPPSIDSFEALIRSSDLFLVMMRGLSVLRIF